MLIMELTQLSLAPTYCAIDKSNNGSLSSESENNSSRKRKLLSDQLLRSGSSESIQSSVDLQLRDRLPLDWEQCLDLESGRMYYLNRKTLRKSWKLPENDHQKLDLELNISTVPNFLEQCGGLSSNSLDDHDHSDKQNSSASSNMVALACLNCHLLVILSKSSPSCPNCKYVHSLPTLQTQPAKAHVAKPLDTLSLLN